MTTRCWTNQDARYELLDDDEEKYHNTPQEGSANNGGKDMEENTGPPKGSEVEMLDIM